MNYFLSRTGVTLYLLMIPTLCAASLLPLHLYREGTHAESDTASPLFFRKPSEEMQPAASSHATRCNGQRSGLQRRGQRHERTTALIHYIYIGAQSDGPPRGKIQAQRLGCCQIICLPLPRESILMRNMGHLKKRVYSLLQ